MPIMLLARNYDPAKAKQLLTQAGYPNGFKTTLIVWPAGNHDIALAEQQYLAEVGIQAEIEFADSGKWNSYTGPQGTVPQRPARSAGPGAGAHRAGLRQLRPVPVRQQLAETAGAHAGGRSRHLCSDTRRESRPCGHGRLSKNALLIPLYEIGSGRAEQPYVVADYGTRGLGAFYDIQTAWLNK